MTVTILLSYSFYVSSRWCGVKGVEFFPTLLYIMSIIYTRLVGEGSMKMGKKRGCWLRGGDRGSSEVVVIVLAKNEYYLT